MADRGDSARVDVWLWAVRVFKSRSQATAACRAGHVRTGGGRAKPAVLVRTGDRVTVSGTAQPRILVVTRVLTKRVGAALAAEAYVDESPPRPPREERAAPLAARERGAGRPTKRDRRRLDELRGR
ncbi:MAG: S4 domain-containing protein [Dermatophilaceae bacterium]